jgi:uncharacterized protein (TIGR00369 family)
MIQTPAVTKEELEGVLAESAFVSVYGFRLHAFGSGECTLLLPFQEKLERPGGIVNGAALMASADMAMWLAIMTQLGKEARTLTADLNSTFLSAARKEDVLCTAKVLKLGRTLVYGVAECSSEAGKLVSHHTVTYIRLDR